MRYPSKIQDDKLAGAVDVPRGEVRNMFALPDTGREYVIYCQCGRRSAAAAFLFAQRGFKVALLKGTCGWPGKGHSRCLKIAKAR